jgi:PadR family transcriptional regulator PadR
VCAGRYIVQPSPARRQRRGPKKKPVPLSSTRLCTSSVTHISTSGSSAAHHPPRWSPSCTTSRNVLNFESSRVYVEAASMKMNSSKSEMPQGTLDMVILQVVAAGPIHGYALAQRIRLISRDLLQIQSGSLYPALHRLENRGFLAAEWNESETGRDAKFYRLTPKGRAQLRKETADWARLSQAIALILQRAEGGAQ